MVRLNALEWLAAWVSGVAAPLSAVVSVDVMTPEEATTRYRVGVAAAGAPLRSVATVGLRAKTPDGRRAFVVAYVRRPGVLVTFDSTSPWGLFFVSCPSAEAADRTRHLIARERPQTPGAPPR